MLTAKKNVYSRAGREVAHPVAASTTIYGGSLIVLEGGFAKPGYAAVGLMAVGMANANVDNSSGQNGDLSVTASRDDWVRLMNSVGDPVARASINLPCYIVDDETVAATDGTGTRSKAGTVRDIDDAGVWISFD